MFIKEPLIYLSIYWLQGQYPDKIMFGEWENEVNDLTYRTVLQLSLKHGKQKCLTILQKQLPFRMDIY